MTHHRFIRTKLCEATSFTVGAKIEVCEWMQKRVDNESSVRINVLDERIEFI